MSILLGACLLFVAVSAQMLGEHEGPGCPHYMFDCGGGEECVEIAQICDGIQHCVSGRDENNDRCPRNEEENPWDETDPWMQEDEDEGVQRCDRELCSMICPLGHVTDEMGCPICECLEDPCEMVGVCGRNQRCQVRHTCTSDPCSHDTVEPQCIDTVPCPMPMCSTRCDEYRYTESGCMTCDCVSDDADHCEGYECPINHQCLPIPQNVPQHMVAQIMDGIKAFCVHDVHALPFLNRFPIPTAMPEPVMSGMCHQFMERMHEEMSNRPEMHRIPYDHEHAMRENCRPDGSFNPVHCDFARHTCWCVNDAGNRIDGSETPMANGQRPQCVQHRTMSTEMTMVFEVQGSVTEMIERVKELLLEKLSAWLGIDAALIEIEEVRETTSSDGRRLVHVSVTLDGNGGAINLPQLTAQLLMAMQAPEQFTIVEGELIMQPRPEKFDVNHESVPDYIYASNEDREPLDGTSSEEGSWEGSGEAYSTRCGRLWHEHKGLVVAAAVSCVVMILSIIAAIAVCCVRRAKLRGQFNHKRMDKYKENLAYTNDMMTSHPDVMVVDKLGGADLYKVTLPEPEESKY